LAHTPEFRAPFQVIDLDLPSTSIRRKRHENVISSVKRSRRAFLNEEMPS
jgi:hypothetical protein